MRMRLKLWLLRHGLPGTAAFVLYQELASFPHSETTFYTCGNCGGVLPGKVETCWRCGQTVLWHEGIRHDSVEVEV